MPWLAGFALIAMAAVMSAAWLFQRRTRNAGWVDAFWSFGTGITGALCALAPLHAAGAPDLHALFVAALALIWSCRLGLYIVKRTASSPHEDTRYARFRKEWGEDFDGRMFWFLMIQAGVAALLAICIMLAARNPVSGLRAMDVAGALLLIASVAGETIADRQMHTFRADAANKGRVCDTGLWAWSRHPNYFFECAGWFAYPLFAIDLSLRWPWGFGALLGPAAMVWLLTRISGIPPLEREMVQSRGEAYRRYQSRVSAFVPLPPKTEVHT